MGGGLGTDINILCKTAFVFMFSARSFSLLLLLPLTSRIDRRRRRDSNPSVLCPRSAYSGLPDIERHLPLASFPLLLPIPPPGRT